ncbi:MAG: hypothetical protein N2746_00360 [Deltaproteobacteria bacterium]|nr:hypothetical protein [Deltaproteobacteria bacterium]
MKNLWVGFFLIVLLFGSASYAQTKDKTKKSQETKIKQVPPKDDTHDYIRCPEEDVYKRYLELKPRYLEIQKKIGEIEAKIKMNEKNLEKLKEMSDNEIDKDVKEENIKIIEDENSRLKLEKKKMEEEGIEFYKIYEPIRHKCED